MPEAEDGIKLETGPKCLESKLEETERNMTIINLPAVCLEGSQPALKKTSNQPASNLVKYPYSRQPKVREKNNFAATFGIVVYA